jgi:hypothetical protein
VDAREIRERINVQLVPLFQENRTESDVLLPGEWKLFLSPINRYYEFTCNF